MPISAAETQLIADHMSSFASRQLYIQDLSKVYDYWFRQFKQREKDSMWSFSASGAFLSSYE